MRRSVYLLVTAGLLPVIALGGTFGAVTLRNERQALERQARTDARFAAALLSVKLESNMRAIEMVAQSPAFDGDLDLPRFRTLAARIVRNQPDWRTVSIADVDGRRIADVPVPIGRTLHGRVVDLRSLKRVVAGGKPTIGDVIAGPRRELAFAIRAPVIKGGRVRYVVSAVLPASRLRNLLLFQPLPSGWQASVVDAGGADVASSAIGPAGGGSGEQVQSWAPVSGTSWSVRITAPARAFSAPLESAAILLSAAAALCVLLVLLLARMLTSELKQIRQRDAAHLQSQRMETLGRLTGGVAHDFNNLLTPILGGLDLIRRRATDERMKRHAEGAFASAERAKSLVARLLAFSRRQALAPRTQDLGGLLKGISDLITRSLTPAIECRVDVQKRLSPALVDPAQLELAILNLVVNARDAMPSGGVLSISARSAQPREVIGLPAGHYVAIEVADAGMGMDEATLRRAVDPFFTTKTADKGTGLGLSMVDGFAAQSGGALRLVSEPGDGTTATIILPASDEAGEDPSEPETSLDLAPGRILVVDDEVAVRRTTSDILSDAGQDVVEASGVDEALAILQQDSSFNGVVTDFVMPGRSGGDLIRAIRSSQPTLPVLLVTGFITATEEIPADVPTLMKPFKSADLIRAVAQMRAP